MMKRDDDGGDEFVTKTAKHRKKPHANGDDKSAAAPPDGDGKPPAAGSGGSGGGADGISLRPRTMFAMKGRGRSTEAEGSAYRPQWSKDGEGFVTAGAAKDAHHDAQGAADAARRKGKVICYSKEELLALHFTTPAPPLFPPETMVASDFALPPVSSLPFDYKEIYEQWEANRNKGGRGRGRGGASSQNEGGGGGRQQSDRSRSNGRWGEDDKWDKPARKDSDAQQQGGGGDDTWQRGAKPSATSSRSRDDIWDNVGDGSSESNEMDLSSMAEAAEKFRLEMDALRLELSAPVAVELGKENNDEFDKKLEVAAAAGQFEDSDEEEVQWDEPTDLGGSGGGSLGDQHGSLFFDHAKSSAESQFGLLEGKQFGLEEDKSFGIQQQHQQQQHHAGVEPLLNLEPLRMEVVDEWFYLDPQGIQQGPFKSVEMREWFEAGYFKPHLPIRFGHDGQFTPLASHFVHGQTPFALPLPQPSPSIVSESDRQRLFALQQQEAQRQELQRQEQQRLQLQQQQQEHQRMLQEEKIRMEMQKLEIARQQQQHQSHLYQQQLLQQQQHQHQLLQQQQQQQHHQQQQQQQHMLLQQQTSWQRSQREGIMSALGIFGGEQDRGIPTTEGFHNVMQPQFQSEFRTQHHLGSHDPALRDSLFLNDGGARQQNEFWGQSAANAPTPSDAFGQQQQQQQQLQQHQQISSPPTQTPSPQEKQEALADPWGKAKAESESAFSLHQIQNEEKRKAAEGVRSAQGSSPAKTKAATSLSPPAATTPVKAPAPAPAAKQQQQQATAAPAVAPTAQKQSPAPAKADAAKKAPAAKPKGKPAAEPAKSAWVDPNAAPTKSLQQIQHEEQRELRKKIEESSGGANLEQMGVQLKMMLGVQPQAAVPQPPAPTSTAASSSSGASPWGVPAVVTQPTQAAKKQSLRDILAEEERLALERAKLSQSSASASSHWVNVVAGTTATPAPKPSRSLGPVPVSVLKSRQQVRTTNGAESGAAVSVKPTGATPTKAESDASFWNFGAAQTAKAGSSSSATSSGPGSATISNAFGGNAGVSSEFLAWAAKQYQLISGREDLTLVEYCVSLEDPGEIREYLAAYLGSTPRVSAFATEFIQRKKKGPSAPAASASASGSALKRSPSSGAAKQDEDAASKKSGGKRRGGKGQKIDPSLLNFA